MANEFINPNWHVILIHYPLGLVVAGFLIELFSFMWRRSGFRTAGRWMILLGALMAIPTAFSGIYAFADAARMNNPSAQGVWAQIAADTPLRDTGAWDKLVRHTWLQSIATVLLVASVVTWIGCSDLWRKRLHLPLLLLLACGVGLMGVGAWYSGEAVYRHGAAVDLATGTDTGPGTAEEAGRGGQGDSRSRITDAPGRGTTPPPAPRSAPVTAPARVTPAPAPQERTPAVPPPPTPQPERRAAPPTPPPATAPAPRRAATAPAAAPAAPPATRPAPAAVTRPAAPVARVTTAPAPSAAPAPAAARTVQSAPATRTTQATTRAAATTRQSNPAIDPSLQVAAEEQTAGKRGLEYYLPPLQTHVFLAGVTVALAMAALGLSIRRVSESRVRDDAAAAGVVKDDETVVEVQRPLEPFSDHPGSGDVQADLSDEIAANTDVAIKQAGGRAPAGRFWLLTALLVLVTMTAGWWTLASQADAFDGRDFSEGAQVLWEMVYNRDLNSTDGSGSIFNRRFVHVLTGSMILIMPLVLAGMARWGPRAKLWLWLFALLLIMAVAAQVWLGILLTYDLPEGPITRFNAAGL